MNKRKRNGSSAALGIILSVLFVTAIVVLFLIPTPQRFQKRTETSEEQIIRETVQDTVDPQKIPVLIYMNTRHMGSGTLLSIPKRGLRILTSAHLFPEQIEGGFYTYRILRPLGDERHPIQAVETIDGRSFEDTPDAVLCVPGEARPIRGFSKANPWNPETVRSGHLRLDKPIAITALTSRKRTRCVVQLGGTLPYMIFPYDPLPGESGMCFTSDADPNELFVLKGHVYTDAEMRKEFGLDESDAVAAIGVRLVIKK